MEYVYRYTDLDDGVVKYIGRTSNLKNRIKAHSKERSFIGSKWKIDYLECCNRSCSEALESHYISYYNSNMWINKAKSNWGVINELNCYNDKWKEYKEEQKDKQNIKIKQNIIKTVGIYDFLTRCREMIYDLISHNKEYMIVIYLNEEMPTDAYTIELYLKWIGIFMNAPPIWGSFMEVSEYDFLNIGCESKEYKDKIICDLWYYYAYIKYPSGGCANIFITQQNDTGYHGLSGLISRHYFKHNMKKFSQNKIDTRIYSYNASLEWEMEPLVLKGIPAFAMPDSGYIKEKMMIGEVTSDSDGNKCFKRYRNDKITDTAKGVAHIIPFGKTIEDYM